MPDQEWYEVETEVEAEPGPPAVRQPREFTDVELYQAPKTVTAKWAQAQLSRKDWQEAKSRGVRLNPPLIEAMCLDAKKGLSKRAIMARAGFHVGTWGMWVKKASEGDPVYELWYRCIMLAYSSVEEEELQKIRAAGHEDWKASKFILETLNREEYGSGSNQTTNITNIHGDVTSESSVNYMSEDDATNVAQLLQAIGVIPSTPQTIEGEVVDENNGTNT